MYTNSKNIIKDYIESSYWHLPKSYMQDRILGKSFEEQFIACIEYRGLETFERYLNKYF